MKALRWQKNTEGNGPLSEVNMTPLIDVSLVLVVILLLATPLAFESSLGVRRTATSASSASEDAVAPQVRLAILSDSKVTLNDAVISVQDLPQTLALLLSAGNRRNVAVACADQVSHGTFVQVLDIAKLSGAMGIAVTEPDWEVGQQ